MSDIETQIRITLMQSQIERLRQEIKMENRKFIVQLIIGITAAVGVGIAIGRFVVFHQ